MTHKMSSEQINWAMARALYDEAVASYNEACRVCGAWPADDADEATVETAFDLQEEIEAVFRTHKLFQAMREAERQMVAWMLSAAKKAHPGHVAMLAELEKAERSPAVWRKLVDLAFSISG